MFYIMKDLRNNTAGMLVSIPLAANSNICWVVADKGSIFDGLVVIMAAVCTQEKDTEEDSTDFSRRHTEVCIALRIIHYYDEFF